MTITVTGFSRLRRDLRLVKMFAEHSEIETLADTLLEVLDHLEGQGDVAGDYEWRDGSE